MNTHHIASSLAQAIDRDVSGQRQHGHESHDLVSLSRRIAAPITTTLAMLSRNELVSRGPVHARDESGLLSFSCEQLNRARKEILSTVLSETVAASDGTPQEIAFAASESLRRHVASFDAKSEKTTELARFPKGIVQFVRYIQEEDEPGTLQQTATTAAKVAGLGAAAYGGAALLRGRRLQPGASLGNQLRAGAAANNATVGNVIGGFRTAAANAAGSVSSRAAKVAALLAGKRPVRGFTAAQPRRVVQFEGAAKPSPHQKWLADRLIAADALRIKKQAAEAAASTEALREGFYVKVARQKLPTE